VLFIGLELDPAKPHRDDNRTRVRNRHNGNNHTCLAIHKKPLFPHKLFTPPSFCSSSGFHPLSILSIPQSSTSQSSVTTTNPTNPSFPIRQSAAPAKMNHYATLNLAFPAAHSPADIKRAYRAALLSNHPDKALGPTPAVGLFNFVTPSVDDIRTAYAVLSDPRLRAAHDLELALRASKPPPAGPTEAEAAAADEVSLVGLPFDVDGGGWLLRCRGCGAVAVLDELEMDEADYVGQAALMVPCESCSRWAKVLVTGFDGVDWDGLAAGADGLADDGEAGEDEDMAEDADDDGGEGYDDGEDSKHGEEEFE
jgi:curved DNA-binding protein CbpA